jgi:hypothetical protein
VRFGDGCATVSGYELPQPLERRRSGKAGARFEARSQDIECVHARLGFVPAICRRVARFSAKEKDEAREAACVASLRLLSAFILSGREDEGIFVFIPANALVSPSAPMVPPRPDGVGGTQNPETMNNTVRPFLTAASLSLAATLSASAQFASQVIGFNPGTGFATEFGTGLGYTNTSAVLGQPSSSSPFGPVDPFNSQSARAELLSIGTGGSLTVKLGQPAVNSAQNPFGLDFIIFGNTGFVITNGDYSGGGITDGSIYGQNNGSTRVSVSADGATFYVLDLTLAPKVDGYYPADGQGDFRKPVDPLLTPFSFSGLGLAGIRSLYDGSAGGTAFDLAWARDGANQPVILNSAEYIRIEVLSGKSEIDGLSAVNPITPVPEPSVLALGGLGLAALVLRQRKI